MSLAEWFAVGCAIAAVCFTAILLRQGAGLRRRVDALALQDEELRAAHQEVTALLARYLAQQEEKAGQDRQRHRDAALPRLAILATPVANGACTIMVQNAGPAATRVRMEFRPPLVTGATPQFDACQTGTTQQFAAQFEAGRPAGGDELRVTYVDASGCNGAEVYGIAKSPEGAIDFHLKRRERAMWN
jgi:hypothetical protein